MNNLRTFKPSGRNRLLNILFFQIFMASLAYFKQVQAENLTISYGAYKFTSSQNLDEYLQPNDILSGKYDFSSPGDRLCARNCTKYPEQRICYYKFDFEEYHAMGPACDGCPESESACFQPECVAANGVERTILSVNRQLPGPAITTCLGDRLVMDIVNKMPAKSVALHSHGMYHFKSPYYDGVPHVTQCSIDQEQTFRYDYQIDTIGTMFYHSHSFLQMMDGIQGPLIVRTDNKMDMNFGTYDYDLFSHTIFIQDWLNVVSDVKWPGYNKFLPLIGIFPDSYLINGHGSYEKDGINTNTPLTVFKVRQGKRYRFRIVAGVNLTPPTTMTVENHTMLLIATDGQPIVPVEIGSLMFFSGERYDVVINAKAELGSYWIQVKGMQEAANISQLAILQYLNPDGSETNLPVTPASNGDVPLQKPIANDVTGGCDPSNQSAICVDQFLTQSPAPNELLKEEPDYRIFLRSGFHMYTYQELYKEGTYDMFYLPGGGPTVGGAMFSDLYNNITNTLPPFPLLSQSDPLPEELKCNSTCFTTYCECLHMYHIPLNKVLEIVITDESYGGDFYHPHHIHGYHARIIRQGGPEQLKEGFYKNNIPKNYGLFPLKDTVSVPARGFAIMRIWATNPGFWAFHCHFTTHNHDGMYVVLQIGERSDLPPVPPGFPKCNNYIPNVNTGESRNNSQKKSYSDNMLKNIMQGVYRQN